MDKTNNTNHTDGTLISFDPIVIVLDVMKRWVVMVLIAAVVGVGAFIVTDLNYRPVYQTSATFVVSTKGSATNVYNNLTSTSSVAAVFEELLNSSILRKTVLEEIGAASFDGTIRASVVPETNLLTMTVTASDPRTAFAMAEAIVNHHDELTYQVVDGIILEVLQNPTVPTRPSNYNNARRQMDRMALLALLASCVLVALLSFNRDAVRSEKEARSKLKCSYLGELPHVSKYKTLREWIRRPKSSILITNPVTSFRFVENVRKLRRRVEQRMHHGKVLMVTSLLENEGKSTVAVNLALSMAQKRGRVLLIEGDLRKPACYAILEKRNFDHGLLEVLKGTVSPQDAIFVDKKSNLSLLLEKRSTDHSANLVSSAAMQHLLEWARAEYDFVVLDLPPMAEASDAEGIADFTDACLLVVRQNAALAPVINKAIQALENSKSKMLGCMLNNVYSTAISSGQGYGYGGYGRYNRYNRYGQYGRYHTDSSKK